MMKCLLNSSMPHLPHHIHSHHLPTTTTSLRMIAFDLMQINDIPQHEQNENFPPPIYNSRPIFNEARLPYRKEIITGAFKTENHEHYLGPMNYEYIDCGAFMFLLDRCSLYCNRWKIAFPRVTWPDRYRELFVTRDEYSKDFLKNLRMYNSAFLMVFCKLDP